MGGAIYFADSASATDRKAKSRGVVLECKARLGGVKEMHSAAPSTSMASLLRENKDSVHGDFFRTGDEWAVFHEDQVVSVRRA